MQLKQTILALLSPEVLQEVCGHLDVDLDCRTKAAMVRHLLPQESISTERLLPLLTEAELQAVCAACGVPATGRKATLVKRLVKQARGPAFVLSNARDVVIRGGGIPAGITPFLSLEGAESRNIVIEDTGRPPSRPAVTTGPGVAADAVQVR